MFQFFAFFYWLVAYYFGGSHWRCLLIHFLSDGLRPIRSCHFYWSLSGGRCDFSYWHGIVLLLVNLVVSVHYGQIGSLLLAFIHSCFLIAYLIVCHAIIVLLALEIAATAYDNLKRGNRGSISCDIRYASAVVTFGIHLQAKPLSRTYFIFTWWSVFYGPHIRRFYPSLYSGTILQYSLFVSIRPDNTMLSIVALYRCGSLC